MDIKSFLSENDIVLVQFQPSAFKLTGMNQVHIMTEDISTVTRWLGILYIEHVLSHDGKLVGFNIANANTFTTRIIPHMLLQALWRDLHNQKQHLKSIKHVLSAYKKALLLTLAFPKTWIVAD